MLTEVMAHFGLVKELRQAGYYETAAQKQMFQELKVAASSGQLIALTGVIGCGKTTTLRRATFAEGLLPPQSWLDCLRF